LDNPAKPHACNFEHAYKGFEIMMALQRSVIERGQVALPLAAGMDEQTALRQAIPDRKVLFSFPENGKEYP
jgi:hypothetical protein